ncbi:MAG: hydroxymethylglutaryl-CoA lyase [Gammaproteobacteria bacterium]|nr:hydroxymethylglutaryl-CoA lyase [Gammaproteobacteria bacterium]
MSDLPEFVEFHEEGPREGFQYEKQLYPLAERVRVVDALSETGLKHIQVASFVNPKLVPSMADTPQFFAGIKKKPGVDYVALWLNRRGFEQARTVPGITLKGDLMFYSSDTFSRKNNNCGADEMRDKQSDWIDQYVEQGVPLHSAYIMCAFGCNFEGDIPVKKITDLVRFIQAQCDSRGLPLPNICLADTVGWAHPEAIKQRIGAVRELVPDARIALHLHDTRGLGAANFYSALQMGVDLFDSSVAGLGGCPFAGHGGAAGNICTEDMVFMCHEMGIETGIDLDRLIDAAQLAESVIGHPLAGHIMHSGSLSKYRS